MTRVSLMAFLLAPVFLAGCGSRPDVGPATMPPAARPAVVAPALPEGAYPGMRVPARLSDGRYATPNRDLSAAGTLWHLRAALNVAALACRGPDEAAIVAGYNALLAREKAGLAAAQASYMAEYRSAGGDWQDRFDDQMTRLYNFFSQAQARSGFCTTAAAILAAPVTTTTPAAPAFAAEKLVTLEKPFTDFFAAYDAWRSSQAPPSPPASLRTTQ